MKRFSKFIFLLCLLTLTGFVLVACGAPDIKTIEIVGKPQYVYVNEEFTLTAMLTPSKASQKDVSWQSSNKAVAEVNSRGKVTPKSAGTVVITAMSKKDSSKKASVQFTVYTRSTNAELYDLTVTYDGSPKSVVAVNLPEGMTVEYKYTGDGYPETLDAPVNAGVYTVKAYIEGTNTVVGECLLRINPKIAVIKIDNKTKVFGAPDPAFTSVIEGLIGEDTVDYIVNRPVTVENVGAYTIDATYVPNPNYTIQIVTGLLTINQLDVKITPTAQTSIYGDPLNALTFEIRDLGGNVLSHIDPANVSGSLKLLDTQAGVKLFAGSYIISATDLISTNLNIRERSTATYTIAKRTAEVNVTAGQGKFAGDSDPELEYLVSNAVDGDDLSGCLSREAGEIVGNYSYVLNQNINPNYTLKFFNPNVTFAVRTNNIILTLKSYTIPYSAQHAGNHIAPEDKQYEIVMNGALVETVVDADGFIVLKGNEKILPAETITEVNTLTPSEQEVYYQKWEMLPNIVQTLNIVDNNKYKIEFEKTYKYVEKIELIVTADDKEIVYKEEKPEFTCTASGLVAGDTVATVLNELVLDSSITDSAGEFDITFTKATLANTKKYYKLTTVPGTLTVSKRLIRIKPVSYTVEDANPVLYGEPERTLQVQNVDTNLPDGVSLVQVIEGNFTRVAGDSVGSYAIKIGTVKLKTAVRNNYDIAFEEGVYQIIPRQLNVTARNMEITYGETVAKYHYDVSFYRGEDGSIAYTGPDPVFSGKLALTRTATLYANNLENADPNDDYYEIGRGNLNAGSNFTINFTKGRLVVNKRTVTLSFIPQTYAYGTEQPQPLLSFSPSLASGDKVNYDNLVCYTDNTANQKIYVLQKIDQEYQYGLEIVDASRTVVFSNTIEVNNSYNIVINEQAVELFYVGANLLNVNIVNKLDPTTNAASITYGDEFSFSDLFDIQIDGESTYTLEYTEGTFQTIQEAKNAGVYTVSLNTNPVDPNKLIIKDGGVDITANYGINIKKYGMLTINKATLTMLVAPTVDDMEYGTAKPNIYNGKYVFENTSTGETEIFTSKAADYNLTSYADQEVNAVGYPLYVTYTPTDYNGIFNGSNYHDYIHVNDLLLKIVKKAYPTESIKWTHGVSFDESESIEDVDANTKKINVEFVFDDPDPTQNTKHPVFSNLYTTANELNITDNFLKNTITVSIGYTYYGIPFSSLADYMGQLPYDNGGGDKGYVKVGNRKSFRAEKVIYTDPTTSDITETFNIYYIAEDGTEYLLDKSFIVRSSISPTKAGIYYAVARINTTNPNYTFSQREFTTFYMVEKAAATVALRTTTVSYNPDPNAGINLQFVTDPQGLNGTILAYYNIEDTLKENPYTTDAPPQDVGTYIAVYEIDADNYYSCLDHTFEIEPAVLEMVWGDNVSINFREGYGSCVDFIVIANGQTMFTYENNIDSPYYSLVTNLPSWLVITFEGLTSSNETYNSAELPIKSGTYTVRIEAQESNAGIVNFRTPDGGAITKEFSIIPQFYMGQIGIIDATLYYDVTYTTDPEKMYNDIYSAMVVESESEMDDYDIILSTLANPTTNLIIAPSEIEFVQHLNRAGYSFNITLTIISKDGNTLSNEKTATLTVERARMPIFVSYPSQQVALDYTGQRIFNQLTDTNGKHYVPTIRDGSSWIYAENGNADVYFGITYSYYTVESITQVANAKPIADAPISLVEGKTILYMVKAVISNGSNYVKPNITEYIGFFYIQKTKFTFDSYLTTTNFTYGNDDIEDLEVQAKNSANNYLTIKFVTKADYSPTVEDGIVCYRYYENDDTGEELTTINKNTPAGSYTAHYSIISTKANFNNTNMSDFETERKVKINPRKITGCEEFVLYATNKKGSGVLYAKNINQFELMKSKIPDKQLVFKTGYDVTFYFYKNEGEAVYRSYKWTGSKSCIYDHLNVVTEFPSGVYYYRIGTTDPNYAMSDYYRIEILQNEVTIESDVEVVNANFSMGNNDFDVSVVTVKGRMTSDKNVVITSADFIIGYRAYGSNDEFVSDPPATTGDWEVSLQFSNSTYLSTNVLFIRYYITAPTVELSATAHYTYKAYSPMLFTFNATYNGETLDQAMGTDFFDGTNYVGGTTATGSEGGIWIFTEEYFTNTPEFNISYQIVDPISGEISYAPAKNIKNDISTFLVNAAQAGKMLSPSASFFNLQNAGTFQAYVLFVSVNTNYAITMEQVSFTVLPKTLNYEDLALIAEGDPGYNANVENDTGNGQIVYTIPIEIGSKYEVDGSNVRWYYETLENEGPVSLELISTNAAHLNVPLNVVIGFEKFTMQGGEDEDLTDEIAASFTEDADFFIKPHGILNVVEQSGNYSLSLDHFKIQFKIIKKTAIELFLTTNMSGNYGQVDIDLSQTGTEANKLFLNNFVSLNGGLTFDHLKKSYDPAKSTLADFFTTTICKLDGAGNVVEPNVSSISKSSAHGTYKMTSTIVSSKFFKATSINYTYTINPKALTLTYESQVLDARTGTPTISNLILKDGDTDVTNFEATVEIVAASGAETVLYKYTYNGNGTKTTVSGSEGALLTGSTNAFFKAKVTLTAFGGSTNIDNLVIEDHIVGEDRSRNLFLFVMKQNISFSEGKEMYSSITEEDILNKVVGDNTELIEELDMSVGWETFLANVLETSNNMITENVVVQFKLASNIANPPAGFRIDLFDFDFSEIDESDPTYLIENIPFKLMIGKVEIATELEIKIIFGTLLTVDKTSFDYNGSTQVPSAKVYVSTFKYSYNYNDGDPIETIEPVLKEITNPGITVTYSDGTNHNVTPKNAGTYNANFSYTFNSKTYKQTVTFTINKLVVDVSMDSLTVNYDDNVHTLTATATYDSQPLTCSITYVKDGTPYSSPKDAGTYFATATVTSTNYEGTAYATLTIKQLELRVQVTDLTQEQATYRPSTEFIPNYTIVDASGNDLSAIISHTKEFCQDKGTFTTMAPKNAGTYTMKIKVTGNTNYFDLEVLYTYQVFRADAHIAYTAVESLEYDGSPKEITEYHIDDGSSSNMTVTYNGQSTAPTNVGLYKVVIEYKPTGTSNYNPAVLEVFMEITPKALMLEYTGYDNNELISVNYSTDLSIQFTSNCDITSKFEGFQYQANGLLSTTKQVFGEQPTTPGIYTFTHTPTSSNYDGVVVTTVEIKRIATTFGFMDAIYTFNDTKQSPSVMNIDNITSGYTLTYTGTTFNGDDHDTPTEAPKHAGLYQVKLTFPGNSIYLPTSAEKAFSIAKKNAEFTLEGLTSAIYDGTAKAPTVVVKIDGEVVEGFTEYELVYADDVVNPVAAGTYNVYVYSTHNDYINPNLTPTAFVIGLADLDVELVNNGELTYGDTSQLIESIKTNTGANVASYAEHYTGKTYLSDGTLSESTNFAAKTLPTLAGEYEGQIRVNNFKVYIFQFVINKASVNITLGNITVTRGQSFNLPPKISDHVVTYTYGNSAGENYTSAVPTECGTYKLKATITEQNYTGEAVATFVINPKDTAANHVDIVQDAFMYDGTVKNVDPKLYISGAQSTPTRIDYYVLNNGSFSLTDANDIINVGTYKVEMQHAGANVTVSQTFQIIPKIDFIYQTNAVYTGNNISVSFQFENPGEETTELRNGLSLAFLRNGKTVSAVKDAGEYTIYLLYKNTIVKEVSMTVAKQHVDLPTTAQSITYGQTLPSTIGEHLSARHVVYQYSTNNGVTFTSDVPNAGQNYKLKIIVDEENYEGEVIVDFKIEKATLVLDLPDITCEYTGAAVKLPTSYNGITGIQYQYTTNSDYSGKSNGTPIYPRDTAYYVFATITETNYQIVYSGERDCILVKINKANPEYIIEGLTQTYSGSAKTVDVRILANGKSLKPTVTYTPAETINVGTYQVTISVEGDSNYNSTTVEMVIEPAAPTITYTLPANLVYDGSPKQVIGVCSSGAQATTTYSGADTNPIKAGDYIATISAPAIGNYAAAELKVSFTIAKVKPIFSYSAPDPSYLVYNGDEKEYNFPTEINAGSDGKVATVSVAYKQGGTAVAGKPKAAGSYDVIFTITSTNSNYASYTVETTMVIAKAIDDIYYALPSPLYLEENVNKKLTHPTNTAMAPYSKSGQNVSEQYKINGSTSTNYKQEGTYIVTLSTAGNNNYYPTSKVVTYVIQKRVIDVTLSAPVGAVYNGNTHNVIISGADKDGGFHNLKYEGKSYDANGNLNTAYSSSTAPKNAGVYVATLTLKDTARNVTYGVTQVSFEIKRVELNISISLSGLAANVTSVVYDDAKSYTATATHDSALTGNPTITPEITIDGNTAATIKDGGLYMITAQVNNANYLGYKARALTITKNVAYIMLTSSAIEYGRGITPQYTLVNAAGKQVALPPSAPSVVLYDEGGNLVTDEVPAVGKYTINMTVQTNGYFATGAFPLTITKATPGIYYRTSPTTADHLLATEESNLLSYATFDADDIFLSLDGENEISLTVSIVFTQTSLIGGVVSEYHPVNGVVEEGVYSMTINISGNSCYEDLTMKFMLSVTG